MATYNREQLIDTYLKSHFAKDHAEREIEPSVDFVSRTMFQVAAYDRKRKLVVDGAIMVLAFLPIAVREAWMSLRGNYFNISSLPFSGAITDAYQFALSPSLLYGLIAFAAIFVVSYMGRPWLRRRMETVFQAIS